MRDALETFRGEFSGWVAAYALANCVPVDLDELIDMLDKRIPLDVQRQIGSAFVNRWLVTENLICRGYCIREPDRLDTAGSHYTLSHMGNGRVAPCWELYVQLGDYARIRTVAESRNLRVRLEDRLMDIAVWAGGRLLLYVENKTTSSQARSLLTKMRRYGDTGFNMDDPDIGNDALRKVKYLFRNDVKPEFFALSSVGYQQLFSVEYHDTGNRFRLIELSDPITSPLHVAQISGEAPPRRAADAFALELDRHLGNHIWMSPGTGRTAFNVYLPAASGDAIIFGVYETGEVWTHYSALGCHVAGRLADRLREFDIVIETSKDWEFWMRGAARFTLEMADVAGIGTAVALAVLEA